MFVGRYGRNTAGGFVSKTKPPIKKIVISFIIVAVIEFFSILCISPTIEYSFYGVLGVSGILYSSILFAHI